MKRSAICLFLTVFACLLFAASAFALTLTSSTPLTDDFRPWSAATNNGSPYWDNVSFEGSAAHTNNIGYYMTKTGDQVTGAGNGNSQPGGNNGPGVAYPFWGGSYNSVADTGGAADPKFFFTGASSVTVTFKDAYSNQDGRHVNGSGNPIPADSFGWFTTNASGTTRTGVTELFNAAARTTGDSATFTPGQYFGFYLANTDRGTFNTISGDDVANSNFDSFPSFQHFSVFQQDADTLWIGVEDLITCLSGAAPGRCIGGVGDQDYNDYIIKITSVSKIFPPEGQIPEPATLLLLGSGLVALAGFARRKFRK